MCKMIVINRGDKEICTPKEFKEYFGFLPQKNQLYSLKENEQYSQQELEECLCSADIEAAFQENNIEFKTYCGDVYVGELDYVEED